MQDVKLRESTSGKSRVMSLARKVEAIKTKRLGARERIIGTKQYREKLRIAKALEHNKPIAKKPGTKSIIKSQGLDKVSRKSLPQPPTILDQSDRAKPIINMVEKIHIPEMEIIMGDVPIVRFQDKPNDKAAIHDKQDKQYDGVSDDYIIAIPSYNRPELIQVKTLALLHRHGIPSSKITIFLANQEQYDLYKSKVPAFLYGSLVIGHIGLKNQRNFIMDYYPEGQHIVQMDDDLDKIMELTLQMKVQSKKHSGRSSRKSKKKSKRMSCFTKHLKPLGDLDAFIRRAFTICKEKGIFLWGVYPLANARFMTPKVTTDLRFIVGPFWGIINRRRPDLHITIDEKENAERTLQHYTIDHAVLRFNNIGIETRYYKNKGGMQDEGKNRKEEALKSVYYLHSKYPKLTKIYLGKKSGVPEIRMLPHSS